MVFTLPCKVHSVGAPKRTPKGWQFRELVVEDDDPRYPQHIPIQFSGDRCDLLDCVRPGDYVRIAFDLAGRQWEERYYPTVRGRTIEVRGGDGVYRRVEPRRDEQPDMFAQPAPPTQQGDLDNLPF